MRKLIAAITVVLGGLPESTPAEQALDVEVLVLRPFSEFTLTQNSSPPLPPQLQPSWQQEELEAYTRRWPRPQHRWLAIPESSVLLIRDVITVKNGVIVPAVDFPALFWYRSPTLAKCSAVQIGPKAIVTAAHCLALDGDRSTSVSIEIELKHEPKRRKAACSILAEFDFRTNRSVDWALCALEEQRAAIRLERISLQPVPAGTAVTVAGFGCLSSTNKNVINHLTMGQGVIETPHPTAGPTILRTRKAKVGVCGGDSGGPTFMGQGQSRVQIAVNSHADAVTSILVGFANDQFRSFLERWSKENNVGVCGVSLSDC